MTNEHGFRVTPRLVLGLVVIALGTMFLLDNLHLLRAKEYLSFWPVVLILVGLMKLLQPGRGPGRAAGVFWILAGAVLLAVTTDLITFRFRDVFPIVLLLGGAYIVWQALFATASRAAVADESATIATLAFMGGVNRRILSQDFRGGEVTAIMGGCEIDLSHASIAEGPAVMDLFAWWGGIELKLPEDWTVVSRVLPFMGGFEDKTKATSGDPKKQLILKGFAIMGGVEVRN